MKGVLNRAVKEIRKAHLEVLVIDDDAVMRELVADWLDAAGYCVRQAADCLAGLVQARQAAPCLIVTDMFMPGPCGAAAISTLKQQHPEARLIAISGYFNSGYGLDVDAALSAGADRALAKPIKRGQLIQAAAELVGLPA
jgi:CheY-like chemotaxis protein